MLLTPLLLANALAAAPPDMEHSAYDLGAFFVAPADASTLQTALVCVSSLSIVVINLLRCY